MKRYQSSLMSDAAFLLLFVLCFVHILFTAGDPNHYLINMILLNVSFLIAIITYFTGLTAGLILNIVFIFGYGTYTIYQTVIVGQPLQAYNYYWLVMTPLLTAIIALLTFSNRRLQQDADQLQKRNATLATLDERTNLKNSRSFQSDATIFMALSNRYKIPLTLLVMTVKHWDELSRMISEAQMTEMIYDISRMSETSIRLNDSLYMLNAERPTWGLLLFTDQDSAKIVVDRLKEKVESFNTVEFSNKYKLDMKLTIGAAQYTPEEVPTPLDFIAKARQKMEYDV
ncbi:diguanylate cyclase domain-containing protein [Paenibacillus sp. J22TS3]|uniref:diguanylate cyclase domain-containing protein n=1 Tax=Paenibacillus sp. J22TS3 TaxID=2807192 RepID=UPI001B03C66D|nr:diguanylate cyclase [Paenibacillus sp. J22TS3]GIP22631.1 GGDEF domain-containing protein [Paenibacillus sp. J22TS3]